MKPSDKQKKAAAPTPPRPRARPAGTKVPGTIPVRFSAIIYNVIGAVVSIIFLTVLFQHHDPPTSPGETHLNSGYDWLLNTMLDANLKTIEANPDKTLQQRYEMKWGQGEITYVFKIKEATPDTAIILLPPKKIIKDVGFKSVVDVPWSEYFLYPRRVVYEDDKGRSPLYDQATYVVSINGWGLDKVKYQVEKPEPFMVLPVEKKN